MPASLVIHDNDTIMNHNTITLATLGYQVHSVDAINMGLRLLRADPDGWSVVVLKDSHKSPTHTRNMVDAIRESATSVRVVLVSDMTPVHAEFIFDNVEAIVKWPYDAQQLSAAIGDRPGQTREDRLKRSSERHDETRHHARGLNPPEAVSRTASPS